MMSALMELDLMMRVIPARIRNGSEADGKPEQGEPNFGYLDKGWNQTSLD